MLRMPGIRTVVLLLHLKVIMDPFWNTIKESIVSHDKTDELLLLDETRQSL